MTQASSPFVTLAAPQTWTWRGFSVAYQTQGTEGAAIVLVHGFGASWQHWRKNIPALAQHFRVYAIDLIGFGASAKPKPGVEIDYTFETWGQQIIDFCQEVIGTPVFLVGNSIGCIVAMQAAVIDPDRVRGIAMLNCSLRLLHDRYRSQMPWYRSFGAATLQKMLGIRWLGHSFFRSIAKPKTVRNILLQAYAQPAVVTDELIDIIMKPAADPAAPDVFIAFTRYSQGPLPQDLLAQLTCPVLLLWGAQDPWEPIDQGQAFKEFPIVQDFIRLENAGHCPQDEVPDQVNTLLQQWITKQSIEH